MHVDIAVMDDRIGRQLRRTHLAWRFLSHGARAQTIHSWSELTRDQIVTLRRRAWLEDSRRLRGPSPSSFETFFSSRKLRSQATLFLCICRVLGVTPARRGLDAARSLPSLEKGERLCEAYELFKEWEPEARLEFEQAILLLMGDARGTEVALDECVNCRSVVLVDKLSPNPRACPRCKVTATSAERRRRR